jgi:glucuronoarabinoxylan endo-1,4-beta-xylanase
VISVTLAVRIALVALGLGPAACAGHAPGELLDEEREPAGSGSTSVCWQELRQTITGFGASSAWTAPDISDELADEIFSTDRIGLSLLRLRITPSGTTSEIETAKKAQARGAVIWAAPWSPPGAWKTNGTDNNGGSLLPEHYQEWADRLALFVRAREDDGVHITALSAQNEPDFTAEWETCRWQPAELATFVRDFLTPALVAEGVAPKLLAPESSGWKSVGTYGEALLNDPATRAAVGIVATHSYNGAPYSYVSPAIHGKEFWMTEWSDDDSPPGDAGMDSGLVVARAIHENLTSAEVNAWHYWWLVNREDTNGNSALVSNDVVTRRAYVTGQYSRFVRPGSKRIRLSAGSPQPGVLVSAFLRETDAQLVIVAVNDNASPVTQSFDFAGAEVSDLVPYVTNDDVTLEEQAPIAGGTPVSYELSPRSVTTLTGPVSVTEGAPLNEACTRVLLDEQSTQSGCSCRQAGHTTTSRAWSVLLGVAGALLLARRSRAREVLPRA